MTEEKDLPLVRIPCDIYDEEFRACKSWRGRFNQYFVYGKYFNCDKWREDFQACNAYIQSGDHSILNVIVSHEEERLALRRKATLDNNVWTYRQNPPSDWFKQLPEVFSSALLDETERISQKTDSKSRFRLWLEGFYSRWID